MGRSERALRVGEAGYGEIGRHFTGEEGGAMIGVAEVHFEVEPGSFLKDAHVPGAGHGVGELPDDVKALAVPILAHRMILKATGVGGPTNAAAEEVSEIVSKIAVPT